MTAVTTDPPVAAGLLLAGDLRSYPAHLATYGPVPSWDPGPFIDEVAAAGLTGRGGSGFPTARKLAAVAAGRRPVVIANAAEGEPASAKDRTLLTYAPHLVLDGLLLIARVLSARRTVIYASAASVDAVWAAAANRADASGIEIIVAPDGFVSGEESAVVAAVEGRPARPRHKAQLIVHEGVDGAPTCVQNVETLAHLALIARYGAHRFRAAGSPEDPGTFLATVTGAVRHPQVLEAPYGLALSDLLGRAGGPAESLRAVLVGGFHGAWVPAAALHTPMTRTALAPFGASPGAGVVIALPARTCPLDYSAGVANYLAGQSAGQCGPCLNGLPRLAQTLTALARGDRRRVLPRHIKQLTALVTGRGACHHPDGSARFVVSTMHTFADDVRAHQAGRCIAGRAGGRAR